MNRLADHPAMRALAAKLGVQEKPVCRKHRHASRGAAEAHVRAILRRDTDWYEPKHLHVYQCPACNGWHVGHHQKEARA